MEKKKKIKVFISIFLFLILGISYVFTRMKGVELDYSFNEYNRDLKDVKIVNKELKAEKAKILSEKRLRQFARKYGLQDPKEKQIIVIHDNDKNEEKSY